MDEGLSFFLQESFSVAGDILLWLGTLSYQSAASNHAYLKTHWIHGDSSK